MNSILKSIVAALAILSLASSCSYIKSKFHKCDGKSTCASSKDEDSKKVKKSKKSKKANAEAVNSSEMKK
jgi:hypothetical protein